MSKFWIIGNLITNFETFKFLKIIYRIHYKQTKGKFPKSLSLNARKFHMSLLIANKSKMSAMNEARHSYVTWRNYITLTNIERCKKLHTWCTTRAHVYGGWTLTFLARKEILAFLLLGDIHRFNWVEVGRVFESVKRFDMQARVLWMRRISWT